MRVQAQRKVGTALLLASRHVVHKRSGANYVVLPDVAVEVGNQYIDLSRSMLHVVRAAREWLR
jgi:hypothetical protein